MPVPMERCNIYIYMTLNVLSCIQFSVVFFERPFRFVFGTETEKIRQKYVLLCEWHTFSLMVFYQLFKYAELKYFDNRSWSLKATMQNQQTQPNRCQKKNSIFSRLHYSNAMKRNDGIKKKKQINEERFDCKLRSKWKIEKHKKSHSGEGSIICARARSMHTWQSNDILICRF